MFEMYRQLRVKCSEESIDPTLKRRRYGYPSSHIHIPKSNTNNLSNHTNKYIPHEAHYSATSNSILPAQASSSFLDFSFPSVSS